MDQVRFDPPAAQFYLLMTTLLHVNLFGEKQENERAKRKMKP